MSELRDKLEAAVDQYWHIKPFGLALLLRELVDEVERLDRELREHRHPFGESASVDEYLRRHHAGRNL